MAKGYGVNGIFEKIISGLDVETLLFTHLIISRDLRWSSSNSKTDECECINRINDVF